MHAVLSHIWLFATPWTVAHQAPLPVGFPRQEYWSGLPFPSPGDLPDQGSNPGLLQSQVDSLPAELSGNTLCTYMMSYISYRWWEDCCCSVAQLCLSLFDPMDCRMPGFPVLHHLLELAQTHVYWVSDAILPSYPLSSLSPPVFNLSQHQGLF